MLIQWAKLRLRKLHFARVHQILAPFFKCISGSRPRSTICLSSYTLHLNCKIFLFTTACFLPICPKNTYISLLASHFCWRKNLEKIGKVKIYRHFFPNLLLNARVQKEFLCIAQPKVFLFFF